MNLEDIQSSAVTLIQAIPALSGVTVIENDGSWPLIPAREDALETDGLAIVVWEPTSGTPQDNAAKRRRNIYSVDFSITVESVPSQLYAATGLNIKPDRVVREILSALSGKPDDDGFGVDEEAWVNLGDIAGINTRVINLTHDSVQ